MSWSTRKEKVDGGEVRETLAAALEAEHKSPTAGQVAQQNLAIDAAETVADGLCPNGEPCQFTVQVSGHANGDEPVKGDSITISIERTS